MRARIHRGAHQIGGTCVEVEADGERLLLDLGLPLDADDAAAVPLPPVPGLAEGDPSIRAVLVSHAHADHFGLIPRLQGRVPVVMGAAAERILQEAAFFLPHPGSPYAAGPKADLHLHHRRSLRLGPFRVTPFLVDHSAFDAYALLVEAGGRRLFYTGDLRAHGRKGRLFEALVRAPPRPVHALLMEGTLVAPAGRSARRVVTERALEDRLARDLSESPGLVLAQLSAQNVDRLVTFYRAARRAGRRLVVDLYTAAVAEATGRPSIPRPGFPGVRVYVPEAQRLRVKRTRQFHRTRGVHDRRIYRDQLRRDASRLVLVYRSSMQDELARAGCLEGARLVWSLWGGYLRRDEKTRRLCAEHGIELVHRHTSGHATPADLARLAEAVAPERLVPIHTEAPGRFGELFPAASPQADGTWWEV